MATVDFYSNLHYDFSEYQSEEELSGLTTGGFNGSDSLHIKDFNELELNAARDVIACYFRPISTINNDSSSYGLKHLVERYLQAETKGAINYVSNGTLILAMYDAGFRIKRMDSSSPNCHFNVSKKSIHYLEKRIRGFNQ